jgi:hypothetical protein
MGAHGDQGSCMAGMVVFAAFFGLCGIVPDDSIEKTCSTRYVGLGGADDRVCRRGRPSFAHALRSIVIHRMNPASVPHAHSSRTTCMYDMTVPRRDGIKKGWTPLPCRMERLRRQPIQSLARQLHWPPEQPQRHSSPSVGTSAVQRARRRHRFSDRSRFHWPDVSRNARFLQSVL